jgi:lysophospholipase L1-like esterase
MHFRRIQQNAYSVLLMSLAVWLTGCFESTDENYTLPGRKYVAMGNSLTSGYQSGGLSKSFQEQSYPYLLAQAMGISDFTQPLIENPGIGGSTDSEGKPRGPMTLDFVTKTITYAKLTKSPTQMLLMATEPKPYGNLGVPGALLGDAVSAYSSTSGASYTLTKSPNPFFDIVLRGATLMNGATMLQQTIAQRPEIVTIEIGNNDILGGVTSGTVIVGTTVTPPSVFASQMTQLVDSLLEATSATLFIANIPKPTLTPFVTSIPPVILNPTTFQPVLDTANQPIPLLTQESGVKRLLFSGLASLLAKDGVPQALGGTGIPIPGKYTLTVSEEATADSVVTEYNKSINALASAHSDRVVVVDINDMLTRLNTVGIGGLTGKNILLEMLQGTFATTSAFSFDGVHPNGAGYKEIAKLFLAAINAKLNTNYKL